MWKNPILTVVALMSLCGCATAKIEDYAANTPALDIREFFDGPVDAKGLFVDRAGKADPRMQVRMLGRWHGSGGTLEEHFTYSDGHTQERLWKIHFIDDHHFTATADDVIGIAQGAQFGNAMNMKYALELTAKGETHNVSMDDWVYRIDENTAINRAEMTKYGFHVGEVIFAFKRNPS